MLEILFKGYLGDNIHSLRKKSELILLYLALFFNIILSYAGSSKNLMRWQEYILLLQILIGILCLIVYCGLSNVKEENKVNDILKGKINEELAVKIMLENSASSEKEIVKAAFGVVITSVIIGAYELIIPNVLRILHVNKENIILIHSIALIIVAVSIWIKNRFYYQKKVCRFYITLIEFLGIAIGGLGESYWNVYLWLNSENTHTIYFGPYVMMGIGLIPFLYVSNIIVISYNEILHKD